MALVFIAIDPETDTDHCPAVFVEEDFWMFDDRMIRFHHFSGDGDIVEDEMVCDPAVIRTCAAAFEAVWDRAIPHAEYRLT